MLGLFKKDSKEPKEEALVIEEPVVEKSTPVEKVIVPKANKEQDFISKQSLEMGLDMKKEVERYSKAFFNSKNEIKSQSYQRFQAFLSSLSYNEQGAIKDLVYLDFKEKEDQIFTRLKNGFAQFLSKGSHLDEETKKTIDMVFGDIKKLPSKGHRYWYYKIYIWQKSED